MKTPAQGAPCPVQTTAVAVHAESQQFWSKARRIAGEQARQGKHFPFVFVCSALSRFQPEHFCLS